MSTSLGSKFLFCYSNVSPRFLNVYLHGHYGEFTEIQNTEQPCVLVILQSLPAASAVDFGCLASLR